MIGVILFIIFVAIGLFLRALFPKKQHLLHFKVMVSSGVFTRAR
jgi:hypothetical protein